MTQGTSTQGDESLPGVSVVVPVVDQEVARRTIQIFLENPYPGPFELLVAAGPGNAEVASQLAREAADPRVVRVRAQTDSLADQLNVASLAGRFGIVARALPSPNFGPELLRRAVKAMDVTGADVVGGETVAVGLGTAERAAARAMNSRLAVGVRPSRLGGRHGAVDSVRIMAVRRSILEEVGGLDQAFAGAQDWELQHRVRQAGGMVWLDPSLGVGFTPAVRTRDIAKRYFGAGFWRRAIMARHADTAAPRYFAPPALLVGLTLAVVVGIVGLAAGWWWLGTLVAAPLVYALAVGVAVAIVGRELGFGGVLRMWWTVMVIHVAWGWGFLFGRH